MIVGKMGTTTLLGCGVGWGGVGWGGMGWGGVTEEGRAVNLAMTWRDGKKQGERLSIFVAFIKFLNAYLNITLSV